MNNRSTQFLLFCLLLIAIPFAFATSNGIADQLGWIHSETTKNLCEGYYRELPILYIPSSLVSSQKDNYDWQADQTTYSMHGASTLKGHIRITQPGQELTADVAHIYSNKKTGKPDEIRGEGHVKLRESNKLLVARTGKVNLKTKLITLHDVLYRMSLDKKKAELVKNKKTGKLERRLYELNARGKAKEAKQVKPGLLELKEATYTTCPPGNSCWKLKASNVKIHSKAGYGSATNTRLLFQNFPILYFPYFSFPTSKKRKSGFLMPSFTSSDSQGMVFDFPYYWNMASNYDVTITPSITSKRGILWKGLFRYLTHKMTGQFNVGYVASDPAFKRFSKKNGLHANQDRYFLNWQHHTQFDSHWSSAVDYNRVSDDYFLQDFGTDLLDNSDNQLLEQGDINYSNDHWNFLGNLQYYQTLHPIDQALVRSQYARIPQLLLNGNYPNKLFGLSYAVNTEFVRFWRAQDSDEKSAPVIGNRMSVRPMISFPLRSVTGYFIPRFQLQLTKYDLGDAPSGRPSHPGLAIPLFDLNTGLYFDRQTHFFHYDYRQTLEPEVYYLYVPYHNQNQLPFFDTTSQPFGYDFMFLDNRFSGIDRIGDANRITLGMTTRFIDDKTGTQRASLSLGQIRYFTPRRVSLCYGSDTACSLSPTAKQVVSPLAAAATYNFNANWSLNAGLTWNALIRNFDNQNINFQYKPDNYHIINMGYNYVRGGDIWPGEPVDSPKNDLKQTDVSAYWQLNNRWSLMGRWNYNWSHANMQAYYYGVAYDSCCWAVRLLSARTFVSTGPAPSFKNKYDNSIYLQFALKGLGNIGSQPDSLLSSGIPGYVDMFGQDN